MNGYQQREWRKNSVVIGRVYVVADHDLGRVGECWMRGRLLVGDLIVALRHSGDCFYDYQLVGGGHDRSGMTTVDAQNRLSYHICKGAVFRAYSLGTPHEQQPTAKELQKLLSGEDTHFSDRLDVPQALVQAAEACEGEMRALLDSAVQAMKRSYGC